MTQHHVAVELHHTNKQSPIQLIPNVGICQYDVWLVSIIRVVSGVILFVLLRQRLLCIDHSLRTLWNTILD